MTAYVIQIDCSLNSVVFSSAALTLGDAKAIVEAHVDRLGTAKYDASHWWENDFPLELSGKTWHYTDTKTLTYYTITQISVPAQPSLL